MIFSTSYEHELKNMIILLVWLYYIYKHDQNQNSGELWLLCGLDSDYVHHEKNSNNGRLVLHLNLLLII